MPANRKSPLSWQKFLTLSRRDISILRAFNIDLDLWWVNKYLLRKMSFIQITWFLIKLKSKNMEKRLRLSALLSRVSQKISAPMLIKWSWLLRLGSEPSLTTRTPSIASSKRLLRLATSLKLIAVVFARKKRWTRRLNSKKMRPISWSKCMQPSSWLSNVTLRSQRLASTFKSRICFAKTRANCWTRPLTRTPTTKLPD